MAQSYHAFEFDLSPWIVDLLRRRLACYKFDNDFSWFEVAQKIVLSDSCLFFFPEVECLEAEDYENANKPSVPSSSGRVSGSGKRFRMDHGWPITAQLLEKWVGPRRPREGWAPSEPAEIKVRCIAGFLVESKWVDSNELSSSQIHFHAAYSLRAHFEGSVRRTPEPWDKVQKTYFGLTKAAKKLFVHDLHLKPAAEPGVWHISESINLYGENVPDRGLNPKDVFASRTRTGYRRFYGWAVRTPSGLLLFLADSLQTRNETYTLQAYGLEMDSSEIGKFEVTSSSILVAGKMEEVFNGPFEYNIYDLLQYLFEYYKIKRRGTDLLKSPVKGELLQKNKNNMNSANQQASEELITACESGDLSAILRALGSGADVNFVDPTTGMTPLHIVSQLNNFDALLLLIRCEDLCYIVANKDGYLPSAIAHSSDVMQLLIEAEKREAVERGIEYRALIVDPPLP